MPPPSHSRVRACLELVRLPNVFTAMADVSMGFLVVHAGLQHFESPQQLGLFLSLVAASCCLYMSGMVLNDVYDAEIDAQERPHRPIPSGRVSLPMARLLGWELLLIGVAFGWTAGYLHGSYRAGLVATVLAGCVLLYDRVMKKTPLGPVAMGACRTFNVLLGMSVAAGPLEAWHWVIAVGIGVYIVGVTWFARTEAHTSSRLQLTLAMLVMLGGIGLLAWFPSWMGLLDWKIMVPKQRWQVFWLLIAMLICWRLLRAIADPQPHFVQTAVKQSILSLVLLDAAVVFALHGFGGPGIPWALLVLLLLIPTMFLGRWIYST